MRPEPKSQAGAAATGITTLPRQAPSPPNHIRRPCTTVSG